MLLAAGLFWLLSEVLRLSARQIFLLGGLATLPVVFSVSACCRWRPCVSSSGC